jgi:3-methyl-2-oxobutanoate hydroxymethyltransferase
MPSKVTAPSIRSMKGRFRIVCLTAYDFTSASLADEAGVDLVLVGDSLASVVFGRESTTGVTLEEVEHHVRAVRAGTRHALLVGDMPMGSYGSSVGQAVDSAVRLVRAGAEAVKLEGPFYEEIAAIRRVGIPVMGHVGMTPQSENLFGGFKVQGREDEGAATVETARLLEQAGVFAVVVELVPRSVGGQVTRALQVPTIGIGAGPECDGEIQVFTDILGLSPKVYRHSRVFSDCGQAVRTGIEAYTRAVRTREFPSDLESF